MCVWGGNRRCLHISLHPAMQGLRLRLNSRQLSACGGGGLWGGRWRTFRCRQYLFKKSAITSVSVFCRSTTLRYFVHSFIHSSCVCSSLWRRRGRLRPRLRGEELRASAGTRYILRKMTYLAMRLASVGRTSGIRGRNYPSRRTMSRFLQSGTFLSTSLRRASLCLRSLR
jgi:hypothetical protein